MNFLDGIALLALVTGMIAYYTALLNKIIARLRTPKAENKNELLRLRKLEFGLKFALWFLVISSILLAIRFLFAIVIGDPEDPIELQKSIIERYKDYIENLRLILDVIIACSFIVAVLALAYIFRISYPGKISSEGSDG